MRRYTLKRVWFIWTELNFLRLESSAEDLAPKSLLIFKFWNRGQISDAVFLYSCFRIHPDFFHYKISHTYKDPGVTIACSQIIRYFLQLICLYFSQYVSYLFRRSLKSLPWQKLTTENRVRIHTKPWEFFSIHFLQKIWNSLILEDTTLSKNTIM